ncbi:hypothetical protein DSO57_1019078 [Entomophthora muscae]|uniref:Uncharacterized protein n=1 Tax=Entomophthora muscae TaxID=34485 RepID=A0ACC2ST87_9FUNG|nr:hypothetical protein DSO57_1019078 [Entomophthora muscae]
MPNEAFNEPLTWAGVCDMCRLRKIKCDKIRLGCSRCIKNSLPCTYGLYRPKRSKAGSFSVKSSLPWLKPPDELSINRSKPIAEDSSVSIVCHMLETLFIDPFGKKIIHEALECVQPTNATNVKAVPLYLRVEQRNKSFPGFSKSSLLNEYYSMQMSALTLTDQDQVNSKFPLLLSQLLAIFFCHVNTYHPLVNQQWAYNLFNSSIESAGKNALLYMIGLIALDFYPLSSAIPLLRATIFSRAHQWLNRCVHQPSFASCLALTLATSYRFPVQLEKALAYPNYRPHELAVRMAYLLGLHRSPAPGLSASTRELRKRLFLALYVFDCMSGYTNNRPRLIPYEKVVGIVPKYQASIDSKTPYEDSHHSKALSPSTVLLFNSYTNRFTIVMDQVYYMQRDFNEWLSSNQLSTPNASILHLPRSSKPTRYIGASLCGL